MYLKQRLQKLERQKNQQYISIRRKINNVLLRAGSKKKCIRNNISLENRGLELFRKGVYDFVSAKSRSRNPVEHIPSRAFPAILSKKHDGEMALISLTDKSIVLAEMCSKGGFNRIPSDKSENKAKNGSRNNLYYVVFDVLTYQGCEIQDQDYTKRLTYVQKIINNNCKIIEQRSRKRRTGGNNVQLKLAGMTLGKNNARVVEYQKINSKTEAWNVSKKWAKFQDEQGEAIEGGVLTSLNTNTITRYKIKPWYDGEIRVITINRNSKNNPDVITSVKGFDEEGREVTVKGTNHLNENDLKNAIITYRRHYCVSGISKGEFRGCNKNNIYQRVRTDDYNEIPKKRRKVEKKQVRKKTYKKSNDTNDDISMIQSDTQTISQWLSCLQGSQINNSNVQTWENKISKKCNVDENGHTLNQLRQHIENASKSKRANTYYFDGKCDNGSMAVLQYLRLPESHPLKKKMETGHVGVIQGSDPKPYKLTVKFNKNSWPKLWCTCYSMKIGNHICTQRLANIGSQRGPIVLTKNKTVDGRFRICKHWIQAIQHPNTIRYMTEEEYNRRYEEFTVERFKPEIKKEGTLPSAESALQQLENDKVKKHLMEGKRIKVISITNKTYEVKRVFEGGRFGVMCSCGAFRNGVGPYKNVDLMLRMCKHTKELLNVDLRETKKAIKEYIFM